ncbi:MAG TPA: maltose alpha-D-glucosyltransferase [Flavisolibacter sp.]|nr:maltose alpha-D-glucosyltransferase [Flavisolibacter sp.]
MAQNSLALDDKLHWYKDAIIYELHIKAFRDSNRDGIGDFKGLMEKLDYLQELGVTTIWLLPFYPSPLKDDGYDIADYYTINPRYGTLDEFRLLLEEAHKRNLKVVTELVINHTSDQHPWFQRARTAARDSDERNFYVWTDNPQQYKDVRIIFQDFETSNWTWDPVAQQYYWHRFFHHQPDLNYDNPLVQEEIFKIIDYWCEMGVDGFRLDAVPYLYEREGTNGENLPETHAVLKELRKHIDQKYPGTAFLAEANMWPEDAASYFGNGDECHMNYHFPVMPRMFMSVQQEDRYPITDIFDQTPQIPNVCQWAIFLRNHDELTLEMVTDEERDFMYAAYAKDQKARINLGIRHRLAPLMDNNRSKIELMNSLLFSLPGTPVIYYGDEIGMGDNYYLGDRDGVRTPMQWSPDRNAGFSETNPQQLYLPVIIDPEYHYEAVNVEMQRKNTSSLFWFMKRMINMRKNYKAFGSGDMRFLHVDNPKILAFTRTYEDETLLIICNLSKYAQPAEVDLREFNGYIPVEIFSKNSFPLIKNEPYFFTLSAHSFQWFALQKVHYKKDDVGALPVLELEEWEDVLKGETRELLENTIFLSFLDKRTWFKGKGRKVHSTTISKCVPVHVHSKQVFLLLIDVSYESGMPETYQLPITFVTGDAIERLSVSCPESVIAQIQIHNAPALLCDANYVYEWQSYLIRCLAGNKELKIDDDIIQFKSKDEVSSLLQAHVQPIARMHSGDENNTSITYNNKFFLKMYRKVDWSINPDIELSYYLSEDAHFNHVPRFLGTIELNPGKDAVSLGLMQVLIENHGDGESYMRERIANYIERIMARNREVLDAFDRKGSIIEPVGFNELTNELQDLLGSRTADQASLIGLRTAEMHLLLSKGPDKDFKPEEYSLHYQRSVFSSMQALVRESIQTFEKSFHNLNEETKREAQFLTDNRNSILNVSRKIYQKKFDIWKTRTHGSYSLRKLLMSGKDIMIQDFGGKPMKSYSARRLKRSPLRDIAEMIISFHYVAYEGFFASHQINKDELRSLLPFAELWAHYISGFFLKAYFERVHGTALIPKEKNDLEIVLNTFLIEKALTHFIDNLDTKPDYIIVPLHIIRSVLGMKEEKAAAIMST